MQSVTQLVDQTLLDTTGGVLEDQRDVHRLTVRLLLWLGFTSLKRVDETVKGKTWLLKCNKSDINDLKSKQKFNILVQSQNSSTIVQILVECTDLQMVLFPTCD